MKHAKIIFFGTPEFAVPTLEALVKAGYHVIAVVTQPDKPVGRGLKTDAPPVKVKTEELGLKVLQPATLNVVGPGLAVPSTELRSGAVVPGRGGVQDPALQKLKILNPDLGVCVAYGKIIPKAVLDLFPKGVLNIHPSLLPKYRGPSPLQAPILNGDKETGVTVMLLDEAMDHGPVLAYSKCHIADGTTGGALGKTLFEMGAKLLMETLPKWMNGKITPEEQDHNKATVTKMLKREDGQIDWQKPVEEIERMVRAYDPWPGTYTMWNGKRLKILKVSALNNGTTSKPGEVAKSGVALVVYCNPGTLVLEQLQLEGKKEMSVEEFLRGYTSIVGSILK